MANKMQMNVEMDVVIATTFSFKLSGKKVISLHK